jgi:integrase
VPALPTLRVENTRTGFCSVDQIESVIDHLPDHAKGPVRCLYLTGWRCREVLALEWRRVDFRAQTITLDAEHTKSGKPRVFPFSGLPQLAELLRGQRDAATALERSRSRVVP